LNVDRRIAALALRQHGLITFRQLQRLGLSRRAVQYRVETGRLHRIHVGVFAVGHAAITARGVLLAAVMSCGSEAALSHVHAGLVFELFPPWIEVDPTPTHVSVPLGSGKGRRAGLVVHRAPLPAVDMRVEDGIPVTSPCRTLLDLGSMLDARGLERAVDQAIGDRRTTVRSLHDILERYPHRRGAAALRRLLAVAERFDTVSRSELEDAFLGLVRGAGLPQPSLNFRVGRMRIDAAWPSARVAVELDGHRWHRTRHRQETDRAREASLRRLGWFPIRYSHRQVFDQPGVVIADLAPIIAGRRA
jgi:very-short-patch-repair endonuclease